MNRPLTEMPPVRLGESRPVVALPKALLGMQSSGYKFGLGWCENIL